MGPSSIVCLASVLRKPVVASPIGKYRTRIAACLSLCVLAFASGLHADSLHQEQSQSMNNVRDVTGGMRYLLVDDDLVLLQVQTDSHNRMTTSLVTMDTANSGFSGSPRTVSG